MLELTSFNRALSLAFLLIIDSLYYGKPTFTPLNFLRTNFSSVSLFYGMNAWHYYLTQAIPILCTTALPFTVHGIWSSLISKSLHDTALKTMLKTIVWVIGIYSLAGHKEWRFIHPILPLLHIFAAKSLVDLAYNSPRLSKGSRKETSQKIPSQSQTTSSRTFIHSRLGLPDIPNKTLFFLLLSLPVSTYIVLLYCSAPISVLSYIRAIPKEELGPSTVGYLMPCHSTPGHAYLHRKELADGGMWALGCEPPLQYVSL
jgi:GPI mannosyltransferase 3